MDVVTECGLHDRARTDPVSLVKADWKANSDLLLAAPAIFKLLA